MALFDGWFVKKGNPDSERSHLNKILDEIFALIGAGNRGDLIQGSNVTLTGTLTDRLIGTGDVTIAATGGGGDPWDFDEGDSTTVYSVGTIDFDEGDST